MKDPFTPDKSNGYERLAEQFMKARNPGIGGRTVRGWSQTCKPGCAILDLGCGHGAPISHALINQGFAVYGVDASPTLIAAFRQRFPEARAECSAVEDSDLFQRMFDGAVAWGLIFLLPPGVQAKVIARVAGVLNSGGKFLFTAPKEAGAWTDVLTGRESVSLGHDAYKQLLESEGLMLTGEAFDEGDNHYYFAEKP